MLSTIVKPWFRWFLLPVVVLTAVLWTSGLGQASPPPSSLPSTSPPDPSPEEKAARVHTELRKLGNEAAKVGRFSEAIDAWTKAYAVRPVFAVACAIGRSELLGRANASAAALWLTRCLRFAPVPVKGQAKELAAQQEELVLRDLARSRVGALRVEAELGAEISVDGRVVGKAPLVDEVFLEPGSHRLAASLGSRSRSVDVVVAGGEARAVDLAVGASGPVRIPAPLRPSAPEQPSKSGISLGWVIAGTAVSVAGIVGGVLFKERSNAAYAQSLHLLETIQAKGDASVMCSADVVFPECVGHRQEHRDGELYNVGSTLSFLGGGLVAAATVGYVLWPRGTDAVGIKADARGVRAVWSW